MEIRLRHAKRLAKAAQNRKTSDTEETLSTRNCVRLAALPKRLRSSSLISSADTVIYSMILEQCRSLAVSLRTAAPRIAKACLLWCDVRRADEIALLKAAIAEIEMCLGHSFGGGNCCSYIGLLNPGAQSITYVAASQHSFMKGRSMKSGEGIAFRCMETSKTFTVEDFEMATHIGIRFFGHPKQTFPFICAPLRADAGCPVGILAVDGLCSNAINLDTGVAVSIPGFDNKIKYKTHPADFYDRLAPFIAKNDEACKRIKLWRFQSKKNKNKTSNALVAARVICGRVCSIDRLKGVGSIYSISWEDGQYETEISFRTIKELLRSTPASLGVGVPCDAALLGFVEYAGKVIGEHLIRFVLYANIFHFIRIYVRLRAGVHAKKIISVPRIPKSTIVDLFQQSLQSSMRCILCARTAEIWEYNTHQHINVIARMGQNFNFRQMCTPRRLLEIPGHKIYKFWEYVKTLVSFPMPYANEILVAPFESCKAETNKGHLLVITCSDRKSVV